KGGIVTLGLKEGGVGVWDLEGVREFATLAAETKQLKDMTPDDVVRIVESQRKAYISADAQRIADELRQRIVNGEIKFKMPATHEEYDYIVRELLAGNLDAALERS
ncbi:MAG: BMP family ABC transporter substrate-binding protein, partial [Candidatus Korarchaeum sp.]